MPVDSGHPVRQPKSNAENRAPSQDVGVFVTLPSVVLRIWGPALFESDLAPSLSALTTGSACGYPGWQNLFAPAAEARCVCHTRGDDRNLVEVYCEHSRGTVQLAGDESRFVSNRGLTPDQQKAILLELASLRLIADAHNDEFFNIR